MVRLAGPFHNFCSQIPSAFLNFTNLLISLISLICFQYMPTVYAYICPTNANISSPMHECLPIFLHYIHTMPTNMPTNMPTLCLARVPSATANQPAARCVCENTRSPCASRTAAMPRAFRLQKSTNAALVRIKLSLRRALSLSYKLQTVELLYWPICGDSVAFVCVRSKR